MKNSFKYEAKEARTVESTDGNGNVEVLDAGPFAGAVEPRLPQAGGLDGLLELRYGGAIEDILEDALIKPVKDLTANPGKKFRGKLLELSSALVSGVDGSSLARDRRRQGILSDVIEFIHAGSLVVDDIEDGSNMRRGKPALHVRYGLPVALNAGNWLYFWPFHLLQTAGFSQDKLQYAYEHGHQTLLRAHFGQAVDVGARIDTVSQERVQPVCMATMELKTGALMGYATLLGGLVAGADRRALRVLREFGEGLGVALQMFDDLGNVTGRREPSKRFEDLMLYRPSWVWGVAAEHSSRMEYQRFVLAVHDLPDHRRLEQWLNEHSLIERGKQSAADFMAAVVASLQRNLSQAVGRPIGRAVDQIRELSAEIARAYE